MPGRLEGKTVLITGTGGRQGRAASLLFAAEGATVVGCDLNESAALETNELVDHAGGKMISRQPVDLGDGDESAAWIDWAVSECGGFDVLYNNASKPKFGGVAACTPDDWRFTTRNELDLVYFACHFAWPHLVRRGGGVVINTASIAGIVAEGSGFAHSATKGGVIALTRQLALEGAPDNIRANSISPGLVVPDEGIPDNGRELLERLIAAQMLQRAGTANDIAYCALYLASDESAWTTGANFVIDGGLTAK
jgi:meso-butanediol dehydrogenase/(S,S)-butanediol dehydrogenase/diacetyl reductase